MKRALHQDQGCFTMRCYFVSVFEIKQISLTFRSISWLQTVMAVFIGFVSIVWVAWFKLTWFSSFDCSTSCKKRRHNYQPCIVDNTCKWWFATADQIQPWLQTLDDDTRCQLQVGIFDKRVGSILAIWPARSNVMNAFLWLDWFQFKYRELKCALKS